MPGIVVEPFRSVHADAVSRLCVAEGWESWDHAQRVAAALTAPGVTTVVALRSGRVLGAIEVLGDGGISWIVGMLVVAAGERRQGIGGAGSAGRSRRRVGRAALATRSPRR